MAEFLYELVHILSTLGLAALLGGIVGLERETANRPAGLRTHVLVAVGSALVMHVSREMYETVIARGFGQADPGRIAAQVVSGIGFLGAGTIMREGLTIRGLTTAASLWVVSAVGLAVGTGTMYLEASVAAIMILLTLKSLSIVERRFIRSVGYHTITVHVADTPGRLGDVASVLGQAGANIRGVRMQPGQLPGTVEITFQIRSPRQVDPTDVVGKLMAVEGVLQVSEEE